MRVITLNANGIRAAAKKGFFRWLSRQKADVVCLQETKAQVDQLTDPMFHPKTFHCYYHSAIRKGYSGVAVFSRDQPDEIVEGLGWSDVDQEGSLPGGEARPIERGVALLSIGDIGQRTPGIQI